MVGSCARGDEQSGSIRQGENLDKMRMHFVTVMPA